MNRQTTNLSLETVDNAHPSGGKAIRFVQRQAAHVRSGGISALLETAMLLLGMALALPFVLLARCLRPFVLIRFGPMGNTGRIGNLAPDTEMYLCERELRESRPRRLDLFYYENLPCNQQMRKMADRKLNIYSFTRFLDLVNRGLPGGAKNHIRNNSDNFQRHKPLAKTSIHLSFTHHEERLGSQALRQWNVSPEAPFFCFIARDPAYLVSEYPDKDYRYHDYRNCDINNYIPAADELTRRGYFGFRMGAVVAGPLAASNPMIIDYASESRTDFLDIYLSAKCRFFLTSGTGIDSVSTIFRRPIACVNFVNLGFLQYSWGPNDLFIPKRFWKRAEGRYLSLSEIFQSGISMFTLGHLFEEHGIDLIENSPEEITDLAVEMDERLNGVHKSSNEDDELQRLYLSIIDIDESEKKYLPRIGAKFLRQNPELVEPSFRPLAK